MYLGVLLSTGSTGKIGFILLYPSIYTRAYVISVLSARYRVQVQNINTFQDFWYEGKWKDHIQINSIDLVI